MEWTAKQMMAVALARQIEDGKTYIIGTGLPLIGAVLAKNTHAPKAHLIFETALFEGAPLEIPTSVSDLRINHQAYRRDFPGHPAGHRRRSGCPHAYRTRRGGPGTGRGRQ